MSYARTGPAGLTAVVVRAFVVVVVAVGLAGGVAAADLGIVPIPEGPVGDPVVLDP